MNKADEERPKCVEQTKIRRLTTRACIRPCRGFFEPARQGHARTVMLRFSGVRVPMNVQLGIVLVEMRVAAFDLRVRGRKFVGEPAQCAS